MKKKSIIIFLSCCSLLFANNSSSIYIFAKGESSSVSEDSSVINITEDNLTPDIYDGKDYSAKIQRTFYENGYYNIEIMIDNKSSDSIIFTLDNSDVDGFQISMGMSCNTINSGKKGVVKFGFQEQEFTDYGIEDFDYLNTVFGVFASENAPAYPLCIKKEVFMKDSNGNSVSVSSSKLQQKIDELNKKIESLETENQELKEQLSEYKNVTPENQTSTEISETVPATSDNENDQRLMNAVVMTADVYNGSNTQIIGQRAFITIPKEVLKQISEKGYVNFLNAKVKDSGYNWFSIICDDGTGICFAGSFTGLGTYGKINNEGSVTETIGNISVTENGYEYESIN